MLEMYEPDRDIVWIDSVSLRKLVASHRSDAQYRPGTSVLQQIGPHIQGQGPWFFLTAEHVPSLPQETQYELPFMKEIEVSGDLARIVKSLPAGTKVAIGISAPKQNWLAAALHALRPDLEYHCLGAAVSAYKNGADESAAGSGLSGSGIEWLRFLATSPKRTWAKITATLKEIWLVRTQPHSRTEFKRFSAICAQALPLTNVKD